MLPEDDSVKIEIYDIKGEKVDELLNDFLKAGNHTINWSANNVASGLYICKITTSDTTETMRMTVLK